MTKKEWKVEMDKLKVSDRVFNWVFYPALVIAFVQFMLIGKAIFGHFTLIHG